MQGSKSTKRTHLEKVWKQTGVKPKELADQPDLPQELEHLWGWFLELIQGGKFSWVEVQAWSSLRGINLGGEELELILTLNRLYAESHHGRRHNETSH